MFEKEENTAQDLIRMAKYGAIFVLAVGLIALVVEARLNRYLPNESPLQLLSKSTKVDSERLEITAEMPCRDCALDYRDEAPARFHSRDQETVAPKLPLALRPYLFRAPPPSLA
jgi:hypothetical protein